MRKIAISALGGFLHLCEAYRGPSGVKNRQNFTLGPVKGLFAPPKIILTAFKKIYLDFQRSHRINSFYFGCFATRVQEGQNRIQESENLFQEGQNRVQEGQHRVQEGQNRIQEGQNRVQDGQTRVN